MHSRHNAIIKGKSNSGLSVTKTLALILFLYERDSLTSPNFSP